MCESTAYVLKNGKEQALIEGIELLEKKDSFIRLVSLLGEEQTIKARVKSLSLVDHKIVLEPIAER
jgi:predicted RNA-binding protein